MSLYVTYKLDGVKYPKNIILYVPDRPKSGNGLMHYLRYISYISLNDVI